MNAYSVIAADRDDRGGKASCMSVALVPAVVLVVVALVRRVTR